METDIRPVQDLIYAEIVERRGMASGIILPGVEQTSNCYAKVLAVGRGEINPVTGEVYEPCVKVGEHFLTMKYMGERREIEGGKKLMLREHGIWAKIKLEPKGAGFDVTDLEPMSNHLLVSMDKEEKNLSGAVYLPTDPQTKFRLADVVKVGPGKRNLKSGVRAPIGVAAGDRVICMRYAGCNVKIKGVEYRLLNEMDLEAVVEKDAEVDLHSGRSDVDLPNEGETSEAEIQEMAAKIRRDNG